MTEVAKLDGSYNLTTPVVMIHPNLHEARQFKDKAGKAKGEPKFGASFVFAPGTPDLDALKVLAVRVARQKWPEVDIKSLKFPFTAGDKLIEKRKAKLSATGKPYDGKADFQAGKVVLKSASKYPPRLAGIENGKIVDYEGPTLAASKGKFYFGVEVLAQFNLVPYDGDDGPGGVTAYLNMVLTTNKGERLSGGASASEVFKGYVGHASTVDPTASEDLDDEIPF